jgi:hypothetical protein
MRRTKLAAAMAFATSMLAVGGAAPHPTPYFHPWNDSSFTGAGVLTINQTALPGPGTVVCKAKITGSVASGVVTITSVMLFGGSVCPLITPTGSATATATAAGTALFANIGYTGPAPIGTCAPTPVNFNTTTAGVWSVTSAPVGSCFVTFHLTTHAHVYAV